ncbi:MAG TPA: RbsD/FucU family protein [Fimbriimonadaceae bacterium]|nr:RbsD/FucU family protein [Fimbriimonadaceae bacterium]
MLRGSLIHPEILHTLASAGHGSKVLIADSNYPVLTHSGPNAKIVYLNLSPGCVTVVQVLEQILKAVPVEKVEVMDPGTGHEPSIFAEFTQLVDLDLTRLTRNEFYDVARSQDTALVIATGEQRTFACAILTVGVLD